MATGNMKMKAKKAVEKMKMNVKGKKACKKQ